LKEKCVVVNRTGQRRTVELKSNSSKYIVFFLKIVSHTNPLRTSTTRDSHRPGNIQCFLTFVIQ